MCSGGRGTIQLRADPKDTQTTAPGLHHVIDATRGRPPRPFRNVDAPPAAVRPPPSPPCSVYQSLSIVPVGALTPPGSHGPPASGLPAPRRRAHRAPSGRRRAPGSLPGRGGGGWRRGRASRSSSSASSDDINLEMSEFNGKGSGTIAAALSRPPFDDDILAFDVSLIP